VNEADELDSIEMDERLVISHRILSAVALKEYPEDRLREVLRIVRNELKPGQVFTEKALSDWAETNGFEES